MKMQTRHTQGSTPSEKIWLSSVLDLVNKGIYYITKRNLFPQSKTKIPSGKDEPVFSLCLTRRQHRTRFGNR